MPVIEINIARSWFIIYKHCVEKYWTYSSNAVEGVDWHIKSLSMHIQKPYKEKTCLNCHRCYFVNIFLHLISILPKNHAGPVETLISDFFRMPKKVGAIDSL